MAERKLDMLVLWDPANIRYFTGFHTLHWSCMTIQPAVYLLPLERDPVIIVPWVVDWTGTSLKSAHLSQIIPQVFGNEDYVVVTKDGCDRFPSFRKDIRSLPFEG